MKKINGFSLMEVLISIGIIAVIGAFTSTLLTRTYKSTNDADLLSTLKQNGSSAADSISESIRMADGIVCYGSNGVLDNRKNIIVIRNSEGKYTRFRFADPLPQIGPVTQNGYIAKKENLNPGDIETFCSLPDLTGELKMTDDNLDSGVSISAGEFKMLAGGAGKDTVSISFIVGAPVNKSGELKTVNIQTTVQVR